MHLSFGKRKLCSNPFARKPSEGKLRPCAQNVRARTKLDGWGNGSYSAMIDAVVEFEQKALWTANGLLFEGMLTLLFWG